MSHLLNKFADKLQGHAEEEKKQEKQGKGMGREEHGESQRQHDISSGTRRKQEYDSGQLYSGSAQGYEGVPSEDTGAYVHSGNTGRDRDSSRAETHFGSGAGRDELEQQDPDTFTSGQYTTGQFDSSGRGQQVHQEWTQRKGTGNMGSGSGNMESNDDDQMMGSGHEQMMGSDRRGRNW